VSRSDRFETSEVRAPVADLVRLPVYVKPQYDEALVSWAHRLAAACDWNLRRLAECGFGIHEPLKPDWWARPSEPHVQLIATRTGISAGRVRAMTLLDWASAVRDDEATGRFTGWRYTSLGPGERERGLAVCPACLQEDARPYLRRAWLVGWVAICEQHRSVLVTTCQKCRRWLRVRRPASKARHLAGRCGNCSADLSRLVTEEASPRDVAFQAAMLIGKRTGSTVMPGVGEVTWLELVMLCDVLLGAIWSHMPADDVLPFLTSTARLAHIKARGGLAFGRDRLASLGLLAWLLEDWPRHLENSPIMVLAARWLRGEPRFRPSRIGPTVDAVRRSRVPDLFATALRAA